MGKRGQAGRCWVLGAIALALVLIAAPSASAIDPLDIDITASGSNGAGHGSKGRSCDEGGDGASWHYDYRSPIPSGEFSSLKGELGLHLDLHSPDRDTVIAPRNPSESAFLLGDASHAAISNERGGVVLRLRTNDPALRCEEAGFPTPVTFDGVDASGSGTWQVDEGTGSYRQATGSGEFTFDAEVAPGADNPFSLSLDGPIEILKPSLKVEVVEAYWAFLGADYLLRRVTAVYRITNTGPGDSFGVRLASVATEPSGVKTLGPVPQLLGDLREGESQTLRVRYGLGLNTSSCALIILGCEFDTRLSVVMPDAFDRVATLSQTVRVRAPDLPPPL